MEAPPQVRRAVILLWFMLVATVIASLLMFNGVVAEMAAATGVPDIGQFMWPAFLGFFILNAILIVCISRRRNWARIVLLVLTIGGLAMMLWPDLDLSSLPWDWWVSNGAFAVLSILALYWLFTGDGAAWFSRRNERAF